MGYREHQKQVAAEGPQTLPCGVITISDTRTKDTDVSGQMIVECLKKAGHTITRYAVVRDEAAQIIGVVHELALSGCAVAILTGGTGIARRDSTFDAVDLLLEKRLPGFGELFRMLSYAEIGAGAMLSRATAGVYHGMLLFSLPGSAHAVDLALQRLILPELAHLVWETVRQ
jgi:molybdenum cofactor biosynthesis protein B